MARIGLVACVGKKQHFATCAKEIYDSPLFHKSRAYVEKHCDFWFILSAKYGLLDPERVISPYEETLNSKTANEKKTWADQVLRELSHLLTAQDHVIILAGENYRKHLESCLKNYVETVDVPMRGLGIGKQLQWLTNQVDSLVIASDIEKFYNALKRLEIGIGGRRLLKDCSAKQNWADAGVYFFFEPNEYRLKHNESRVVRVGTHGVSRGSKATLWNRLRTHRGTKNGLGNHRSSIFRLYVGEAIIARNNMIGFDTWGKDCKDISNEHIIERLVSSHIGSMEILFLTIGDKAGPFCDRAYIERNVIGLLSHENPCFDLPSVNWLGSFSPNQRIRNSGLWNLDFLGYQYDPDFFDIFEKYVDITLGNAPETKESIAPWGWYLNERSGHEQKQKLLF